MSVREFIQAMLLIFCMLATGVILPIGLVAGNASHTHLREGAVSPSPDVL